MRLYDYAASGNCFKVRLLLGLLGRAYERVPVDIFAGDTLTDAYAAINPLRETPVLELDAGARLAQSSAILWYLAEGTPFLPEDAFERAAVGPWLSFEQERVMGGLGNPRFRLLTGRDTRTSRHGWRPGAARCRCSTRTSRRSLGRRRRRRDRRPRPVPVHQRRAATRASSYPPQVSAWLDRIRALPGFVDDFVPYPANARPGRGRSIYDNKPKGDCPL